MSTLEKPFIKKLGTIDCDLVETTPIVFHEKLYRYEYVRKGYKLNKTGNSYNRFVDVKSGNATPAFAPDFHLGSAYVQDETVYVYCVPKWGAETIQIFWSKDLDGWSTKPALSLPNYEIFNTSVCRNGEKYVMAFEIGGPPDETGVPSTIIRFAESQNLLNWKLTPFNRVFSKERFTACPALRFFDGFYYMIYLAAMPDLTYETHVVRSKDLAHWENSSFNPVLHHSLEDKLIANHNLTAEQRSHIAEAVNVNNSDMDLCEFKGKTIIYYSWGDQKGIEFLAEAIYGRKLKDFFCDFFPLTR